MRTSAAITLLSFIAASCWQEGGGQNETSFTTDTEEPAKGELAERGPDNRFLCGGETTQAKAEEFFADLNEALASDEGPAKFNRFMAPEFSVSRADDYQTYKIADFDSVTPRFITIDDWQQIAARGLEGTESAGWRGCMMDHGKVWLDASGIDGILLRGINHDMDWVEPIPEG